MSWTGDVAKVFIDLMVSKYLQFPQRNHCYGMKF